MDFFNIGTWEALVLALLALLLFGPEDMLKAARKVGAFTQEMRRLWQEAASALEQDVLSQTQEQTEETAAAGSHTPSSDTTLSEDHGQS